MIFKTLLPFLVRDWHQTMGQRIAFVLDAVSIFLSAATFYFLALLIDPAASPHLSAYGGGYFPFVLIGLAFATFQVSLIRSFDQRLRQEQINGTIESLLVAPVKVPLLLGGWALWDVLYALAEVAVYFVLGCWVFGWRSPQAEFLAPAASVFLSLAALTGVSLLAAAFLLRFKGGGSIAWLVAAASNLLGGVYFPASVLPDGLRSVSDWIPMTHALEALRLSLLAGAGWEALSHHLLYLTVFSLVAWPAGILAFQYALHRSRLDGSLSHY